MKIYILRKPESPSEDYEYSNDLKTNKQKASGFQFEEIPGEGFSKDNDYDFEIVKYIKLLECEPDFEKRIKIIRKEFNIPDEGYKPGETNKYSPLLKYGDDVQKIFDDLTSLQEKIQKRCDEEFKDYNIPFSLRRSLSSVVTNNYISTFGNYKVKTTYAKDPSNIPVIRISIDLYSPLQSSNPILKELESHWIDILKLFPISKPSILDRIDIIDLEIWGLECDGNFTDPQIADFVNEKYKLKGEKQLDYHRVSDRLSELRIKHKKIFPQID
jgi:hypothetical protein